MNQPFELRKVRDFGQIINDSFTFLKENFKPLFKVLLILCGFFILVGTISTVFTYLNMSSVFDVTIRTNRYDAESKSVGYLIGAFISAFILMFTQAFIHLITLCYISVYLQKKNTTPTLAEVWGYFRYYFFRVLGSGILIILLLIVGTLLCVIPGIYMGTVLYLVIPVIVVENSSFSYAFNKSFRLIKGNWWMVFGVIFIMGLIVGMASSIAGIPITIIGVGGKFLTLKSFQLPLLIIFSLLRNVLLLAYVLPSIAVCLCYFSLSEQKDGTGLLDRIDQLGKSEDENPGLPAEEY